MLPEAQRLAQATGGIDFSARAELSEWMDEPCAYEDFRDCLRDLAQVNRLTLAYRPTRIWLERVILRTSRIGLQGKPLHIVDVGCGQGDMLRYISRWARRKSIEVLLTGIDLNPYAARAASEISSGAVPIEWVTGDAFSFAPRAGIDIVISSLFTHHLADHEIVRFMAWMESEARYGWFINDLHRRAVPYHIYRLLAWAERWHPFVQHDGAVSIRRSFRRADWLRYIPEAGIDAASVSIEEFRPARLCVARLRPLA